MQKLKVGIIGLGRIGTTLAEELSKTSKDYLIYPFNRSRDKVLSLPDELTYSDCAIITDKLEDILEKTDITVITASGVEKRNGNINRISFLEQNIPIITDIGNKFKGYKGKVLIVTNPVDECTFNFWNASGLDTNQIMGLNHTDSVRYRRIIRKIFLDENKDIPLDNIIGCYTIGPHNDLVFPLTSKLDISGQDVAKVLGQIGYIQMKIANYAETQLGGRTSTTWTTVEAICGVLKALYESDRAVSVSTYYKGLFIGLPVHFVGSKIIPLIDPLTELTPKELKQFYEGYERIILELSKQGIDSEKLKEGWDTLSLIDRILSCFIISPTSPIEKEYSIQEKIDEQKFFQKAKPYIFTGKMGIGAHGSVYRAIDIRNDHLVAIKRSSIKDDIREEKEMHEKLSHPQIITFIDYFENNREGFLVTEYATGDINSLRDEPIDRKLAAIIQLFSGLEYIHSKNIVHLDLKPENILLVDDSVLKLADFALSQDVKNVQALDTSKWAINYAAPELSNGIISPLADIYSAGAIAFELLTGLSYRKHSNRNTPFFNPSIMGGLNLVVSRCLEKDIAKRYSSAREVLSDIFDKLGDKKIKILCTKQKEITTTRESITGQAECQGYGNKDSLLWGVLQYKRDGKPITFCGEGI